MQLLLPDTRERCDLVARWLSHPENAAWLDVGDARGRVTPEWITIAVQRGRYALRLFTPPGGQTPIGVVALDQIDLHCRTASIWVVLGDKAYAGHGYATQATSRMLTVGFEQLGLHAIHTWIVEGNPSIHVARRVGFRLIGRQRQCHVIDGRPYDRLWFDLLACEHKEVTRVAYRPAS